MSQRVSLSEAGVENRRGVSVVSFSPHLEPVCDVETWSAWHPLQAEEHNFARLPFVRGFEVVDNRTSRVVGIAGLTLETPSLAVVSGAVDPDFRSRGVGRNLVRAITGTCGSDRLIVPCIDPDTGAPDLLASEGFEPARGMAYPVRCVHELGPLGFDARASEMWDYELTVSGAIPLGAEDGVVELEAWWRDAQRQPEGPDLVQGFAEDRDGFVVCAWQDGQVVGLANAVRSAAPGLGLAGLLVVHPAHRGRGLATALKRCQLEHAFEVGWERLRVDLPPSSPAVAINEAFGGRILPDTTWHSSVAAELEIA